ncbi:jg26744 [Pararge aegeria aegeria]|uniref:Jg26744 protein n=1 Tax=Pararge aegeria aegeria TaxID=348720 RepID=A0A8S4S746_9NEOP|nr:jg26744 [Pararge aegeria aegeria]
MATPNSYKQNTSMSMPSPQTNPHYMIAGPPMSFGMMKGGMNAPPHHNQYQYHPQYQGGPGMGPPGGYAWQQHRFGAESARRTAGAATQASKDDKTSPFVSSIHSHPGFQPQKIGKGAGGVEPATQVDKYLKTRSFNQHTFAPWIPTAVDRHG